MLDDDTDARLGPEAAAAAQHLADTAPPLSEDQHRGLAAILRRALVDRVPDADDAA